MGFDLAKLTTLIKENSGIASLRSSVLGIDIGSSSIKIIQLHDVKGIPTLETYGELQLGPYEGVDLGRGTHLPVPKIVEALIDILREAGASAKDASFSLSYNSSFTTTIQVPTIEQEKLGTMIPVEARKFIPVSLTKVDLDWFPLSVHPEEKTTSVLVSAIYHEAKERYTNVIEGSGLKISVSEIEIFSMIRSVLSAEDEVVAILDFGASSTRMCIVQRGVVVKTHSITLSGVELSSALAKALSIEFKDAEELKREVGIHGKESEPRIQKTLIATLERGLREIHTVIKRYEESEQITVQKVVLCGSGALLKGLDVYIQDMFSRPVVLAKPFAKVAYPAFLEDTLTYSGPVFAGVVGVAIRAIQKE